MSYLPHVSFFKINATPRCHPVPVSVNESFAGPQQCLPVLECCLGHWRLRQGCGEAALSP